MERDPSPYAILGLRPGAGPVAIEAAYRRLIKLNHPDRGGDPARAAEINGAYQQLRREFGRELGRRRGPPVPVRPREERRRRFGSGWAVAIVALAVLAVTQREAIGDRLSGLSLPVVSLPAAGDQVRARSAPLAELSEAPLDTAAIDRSVIDATRLAAAGQEQRLAEQSRACHQQLHRNPEPSRLDRCVAFDEAVVALLARDPFEERGPFGASAMTARHLASGRLLSSDTLAVESRLARIRTQVELSLAPIELQPPAAVRED